MTSSSSSPTTRPNWLGTASSALLRSSSSSSSSRVSGARVAGAAAGMAAAGMASAAAAAAAVVAAAAVGVSGVTATGQVTRQAPADNATLMHCVPSYGQMRCRVRCGRWAPRRRQGWSQGNAAAAE